MTFTVHPVPSMGAEDALVAPDGTVWTGTEDGAIRSLDPATGSTRRIADTGGRPLGLELLGSGHLLVCDDGRLVHDVDIDHTGYHMVTGVREHDGKVWMGSLHEPSVAVHDLG
jgi:streptogramin lyase